MLIQLLGIIFFVCHLSNGKYIQLSDKKLKVFYDVDKAEDMFREFIEVYGKKYKDETEYNNRLQIFIENLHEVNRLNNASSHTVYGITHLHDLSAEEFRTKRAGCMMALEHNDNLTSAQELIDVGLTAPETLDWREKNVVTPVQAQGQCNSCWSFSAAGTIEGQYAMKHGQLVALSEQQLVSCNGNTDGCSHGWFPDKAFQYVKQAGGIMSSEDYPYNVDDQQCQFDPSKVVAKVTNGNQVSVASEDQLKDLLSQYGPLAIGVDDNPWKPYHGGVLPAQPVGPNNHAVLLVGYGSENGLPYWTIKNSWGQGWGEAGYIRVERGKGMIGSYAATVEIA